MEKPSTRDLADSTTLLLGIRNSCGEFGLEVILDKSLLYVDFLDCRTRVVSLLSFPEEDRSNERIWSFLRWHRRGVQESVQRNTSCAGLM